MPSLISSSVKVYRSTDLQHVSQLRRLVPHHQILHLDPLNLVHRPDDRPAHDGGEDVCGEVGAGVTALDEASAIVADYHTPALAVHAGEDGLSCRKTQCHNTKLSTRDAGVEEKLAVSCTELLTRYVFALVNHFGFREHQRLRLCGAHKTVCVYFSLGRGGSILVQTCI